MRNMRSRRWWHATRTRDACEAPLPTLRIGSAVGKPAAAEPGHHIPYRTATEQGIVTVPAPCVTLAAATLQAFLDEYAKAHPDASVDYIHGDDTLTALAAQPGRIGFYLPSMNKNALFETVTRDGATPRKTFSLGEAHEKRYYLECRLIG